MRRLLFLLLSSTLCALAWAPAGHADTPGEDGVDVVYLLRDCTDAGKTQGTDCEETVADLQDLIWGTGGINPTAGDPLVVDIGRGDFVGTLTCDGDGHVTFRGVGRKHSRLLNPTSGGLKPAFSATNCDDLDFQDLGIHGINGDAGIGVVWAGGGESTWTDVEMSGNYAAWLDFENAVACDDEDLPVHYFFGSHIRSGGSYAYFATCGEHWFYGSEILMRATETSLSVPRRGIGVSNMGDVRVFGGTIRVLAGDGFPQNQDFVGVALGTSTQGGGTFHMHGGIISVHATGPGKDAIGIDSQSSTSFTHTVDTAFIVNKGSGDAIRVQGPGTILSPMLWQSGTDVPLGGIESQTGKDLFVETDCDSTGCGGGPGQDQPHLMIYSETCGSDPWFDVVRGACRN